MEASNASVFMVFGRDGSANRCYPHPEHPWAYHDNVQIRLHPFTQSIHEPTMITSRSDSVRSLRA